mgnify:CR=1 FL=1
MPAQTVDAVLFYPAPLSQSRTITGGRIRRLPLPDEPELPIGEDVRFVAKERDAQIARRDGSIVLPLPPVVRDFRFRRSISSSHGNVH